jgi:hypothetical protein
MKISKIFPGICLLVLCTTNLMPTAQAALINSPSQPIILQGSSGSDTSGLLSFARLNRVKADGTVEPFSLPSNKSIVITWLTFNITAVDTSLATNLDLRVGPFYSRSMTTNNGAAGLTDGFDPGFIINSQGFTDPLYNNFSAVNLKTDGIIPSTINVRLVGYLVSLP